MNTSKESLRQTDVTSAKERVYEAIRSFGSKGCISDDVRQYCNTHYGIETYFSTVTARYKSLEEENRIKYTGETRLGRSGRKQRVMVAA